MFRSSRTAEWNKPTSVFRDILRGSGRQSKEPKEQSGEDDSDENAPAILAAYQQKDYDRMRELLAEAPGAAYEAVKDQLTVPELAAAQGDLRALRSLKAAGVDLNRRCPDGRVPLHHALKARRLRTVRVLSELGASADVPYRSGAFPLHRYSCESNVQILRCLLTDCKANPEVFDRLNNTPLQRACLEDSYLHVAELVGHCSEAVLNHRGYEGRTALHTAIANQNRRIVRLLLQRGAFVDIAANNGKTAIDMIMSLNSAVMMGDLAHFYTDEMDKAVSAASFEELIAAPQFAQFLGFLEALDNEFQTCSVELCSLEGDEKESDLLGRLVRESKLDQIEFKEIVMKLLYTDAFSVLPDDEEIMKKVAGNFVRYVLYKEDVSLLNKLIARGVVWSPAQALMESRIESVYLHTPDRGVAGVLSFFTRHFVRDRKLDWEHLTEHFAQRCSTFNMPAHTGERQAVPYQRNPMATVVAWAILTGRFKIVETLLKLEQFDVMPLALFAAALIRTFLNNDSVSIEEEFVEEKAMACEKFAAQVVEAVYDVDTSYKKQVTVDYLLCSLPAFGGASCVDIAGKNGSAAFLQTVPGQLALEKKWYGLLKDVNPVLRELLIWFGAVPLNPLVPWFMRRLEQQYQAAQRRHRRPLKTGEEAGEVQDASFLFTDAPAGGEEEIVDEPDEEAAAEAEAAAASKEQTESSKEQSSDAAKDSTKPQQQQQQQQQQQRKKPVSLFRQLLILYFDFYQIPAVKFRYHGLSHVVMVLLMSYVLLIDWSYRFEWTEMLMYAFVFGFLLEEAAEFSHIVLEENVSSFFASKWNLIDIAAVACALVSFVVRLSSRNLVMVTTEQIFVMNFEDTLWYIARVFLSISCLLYWVRLLYVSTVMETLGPKLKMITKMTTKDMLPFLFILFIFIFGFGVLIQSLLFPNGLSAYNAERMSTIDVLLQLFKICFYGMVGDYSLDLIMGDDCDEVYSSRNGSAKNCPHSYGRYLVPYFVMPLYVIVTEILLLNLIIALFSKTIDEIDSKSKALWQFERNDLIDEFRSRSSVPPPLNILLLAKRLVLRACKLCCPSFAQRFRETIDFDQKLVLQFLLFQAFGLRNRRSDLMEENACSSSDGNHELCDQIHDIIKNQLQKQQEELQQEQRPQPEHKPPRETKEELIEMAKGSMLDAGPTSSERRASRISQASKGSDEEEEKQQA